jgi:hypothetical protein
MLLLWCFLCCLGVYAQAPDSLHKSTPPAPVSQVDASKAQTHVAVDASAEVDDGNFFIVLLFMGLAIVITYVVVGLLLTAAAFVIVVSCISAGILSASIVVGLYKRSFTKGFKAFIIVSTAAAGTIMGAVGLWLLHADHSAAAALCGAGLGLVSGIAFGFLSLKVLQRLVIYFKEKLNVSLQ